MATQAYREAEATITRFEVEQVRWKAANPKGKGSD